MLVRVPYGNSAWVVDWAAYPMDRSGDLRQVCTSGRIDISVVMAAC